jgi:hypothetical protein
MNSVMAYASVGFVIAVIFYMLVFKLETDTLILTELIIYCTIICVRLKARNC